MSPAVGTPASAAARFSWLLAAAYPIATRPPVDYGAAIVGVGSCGPGPLRPAVLAVARTTL
ncbi:hypothetical protein [Lentzea sp. CC55]|uniref:hypothetical protein n=1 Tax=Lentzea sp. CC55 TaxID=2884909 RepID=UPI001F393548|nr:hypothetical protein [Lentzea sp. CC55]MCG8927934.1 hypothetical protein [Lentzea sp. CC55]